MSELCDGTLVINRRQLSRPEPEEPGGYRRRTWRLGGSGKGLDPTPVAAQSPAGLHLGLESRRKGLHCKIFKAFNLKGNICSGWKENLEDTGCEI